MTSNPTPNHRLWLFAPLLAATLACGGGGSPTAPEEGTLHLAAAQVSVDGQVVTDSTYHHAGQGGASTRFEARLERDGAPAVGEQVWADFDRPSGMGGMMAPSGRFRLYDDGTHGDHVPGDGLYCFEDTGPDYGFHDADCPHGDYHYELYGRDHGGHESNHMRVTVRVEG